MTRATHLNDLIDATEHLHYEKGDVILRPYDEQKDCFVILHGLVKVYSINTQGEEVVQVIMGEGELFPLTWITGRGPSNAFFESLTNITLARIPKDHLYQAMLSDPKISFAVLSAAVEMLTVYATRIDNLEYKYARERLAYRLLVLAHRFGKKTADSDAVFMPIINQQLLGGSVKVSRESTNRELRRFEKRGLIKYVDGQMALCDPVALRKELGAPDQKLYFDA